MIDANFSKEFQSDIVTECAAILEKRKTVLLVKRVSDLVFSFVLIILLFPVMFLCAFAINTTDDGPVIFKQIRVGRYGKMFNIYKFRTMTHNSKGTNVTIGNDERITKVGRFMRSSRLDEIPQLFNVLKGDMSFVGPRPEVPQYVAKYKNSCYASLLIRPGITCRSSIEFSDESKLMNSAENADEFYINQIIPKKCSMNINYVKNISLLEDVRILFATIRKVF